MKIQQTPPKKAPPAQDQEDFMTRLQQIMIELGNSADVAALVAAELQAEWGGDRPYIRMVGEASRQERSRRNAAIVRDHARGEATALISRRYGICARRVRQIVCAAEI